MSKHTRLVREWANETEPLRLFGGTAAQPALRPLRNTTMDSQVDQEQVLQAAQLQIDQMRQQAAAEIEAQKDQMYAQAMEQARQELQSEFESLVDASFERFNRIVVQARADQERIVHAAEKDLIEMAVAIAREATGEPPSQDVIERRVQHGLSMLSSSEVTSVLLNPDDVTLVTPWIEQWQRAEGVQVEIVPDRTVEAGGCEIVARSAIYDFSPQARLQMIADALRDQENGE